MVGFVWVQPELHPQVKGAVRINQGSSSTDRSLGPGQVPSPTAPAGTTGWNGGAGVSQLLGGQG